MGYLLLFVGSVSLSVALAVGFALESRRDGCGGFFGDDAD